ncbi:hypothetical protein AB4Z38_05060 [Arthrobacter sp. 2RAF6]|uniref:hypothetical protein n=1 Tax=Arthrobacter sp. 2RAF6 TaxID=3233002 RepID=UPI003F92B3F3
MASAREGGNASARITTPFAISPFRLWDIRPSSGFRFSTGMAPRATPRTVIGSDQRWAIREIQKQISLRLAGEAPVNVVLGTGSVGRFAVSFGVLGQQRHS